MTGPSPLLEARGLSKRFPGVRALDGVDLLIRPGEVVSVIGENGAGKSTLMKILAGVQAPDTGDLNWNGKLVRIGSVREALDLGISLIHQELNLAGNLDVAANVFLGREPTRLGWIDRKRLHRDAAALVERVGLDVPTTTRVDSLSTGRQQLVEIAKALSVDARLLIMDEPTSSLSTSESEKLFEVVRELRDQGVSVLYVSHRLGEVKALSDRVVVLRDGALVGELVGDEIQHDAMVQGMVGRDVARFYVRTPHEYGPPALQVDRVRTAAFPAHELSFTVREGEVVGIAGLVGAGRTELVETLFGVSSPLSGTIRVHDREARMNRPSGAVAAGLALVPEDRKAQGLITDMTIRENVSLARLAEDARFGVRNGRAEEDLSRSMVARLGVKTPSDGERVGNLSGGNQQKVVLGKWLATGPRILILDEPTRGIDVGAKSEIYALMDSLAKEGVAILFVSSEMEEILGVADRVLVMHEGRISGELACDQLSEEAVMRLATSAPESAA